MTDQAGTRGGVADAVHTTAATVVVVIVVVVAIVRAVHPSEVIGAGSQRAGPGSGEALASIVIGQIALAEGNGAGR